MNTSRENKTNYKNVYNKKYGSVDFSRVIGVERGPQVGIDRFEVVKFKLVRMRITTETTMRIRILYIYFQVKSNVFKIKTNYDNFLIN